MPFNTNWYDAVVVVALGYGVWCGVQRGISGEMVGIIGLVLTVALALFGYEPVGNWLHGATGWVVEITKFIAFVGITVAMYLVTCVVRALLRRRLKQRPLAATVESVGGAVVGLVRMVVVMAAVTMALCLTRSEFWHEQVGRQSRFGSFVVRLVPDVTETLGKKAAKEIWFMRELKRPPEPGIESISTNGPAK